MRDGQKELIKESLDELDNQPTQELRIQTLFRMFKEQRRTLLSIFNTIITLLFGLGIIYLWISGHYNVNQVDITIGCDGKPINTNFTLILNQANTKVLDVLENNQSLKNKQYDIPNKTDMFDMEKPII